MVSWTDVMESFMEEGSSSIPSSERHHMILKCIFYVPFSLKQNSFTVLRSNQTLLQWLVLMVRGELQALVQGIAVAIAVETNKWSRIHLLSQFTAPAYRRSHSSPNPTLVFSTVRCMPSLFRLIPARVYCTQVLTVLNAYKSTKINMCVTHSRMN